MSREVIWPFVISANWNFREVICNMINHIYWLYVSNYRPDMWHPDDTTPPSLSVSLGDRVTISCRPDEGINDWWAWYQWKPGNVPKLLIYHCTSVESGVSSRFSGSEFGKDFTLAVSKLQCENIDTYYCQQCFSIPITMRQVMTKTTKECRIPSGTYCFYPLLLFFKCIQVIKYYCVLSVQ